MRTTKLLAACLLTACVSSTLTYALFAPPAAAQAQQPRFRQPRTDADQETPQPSTPRAAIRAREDRLARFTPEEQVSISVYDDVNRSVVHINTQSFTNEDFFFFDSRPEEGSGSGSIIDRQGHILTNFHVIQGSQKISATLFDGSSYDADVVGVDPTSDTAVIRIDAPAHLLDPVEIGTSSDLRVGQRVFAIGNPFGLERTLTTGIISSLNRTIPSRNRRTIRSIIQIDAAINPGNSGGPLLDTRHRLIGMNTAIASRTGQSAGVGFAIPANTLARVIPQLIQHGRVVRAEAGIARVYPTEDGLLVVSVSPGGPADRAGLRGPRLIRRRRGPFVETRIDVSSADLITAVDGEPVANFDELLTRIERHRPGEQAELTVIRPNQDQPTQVVITLEGTEG